MVKKAYDRSVEAALREADYWLKKKEWRGNVLANTAKRWTYGRPFWSVTVADVNFPYGNELTSGRDIGLLVFDDGEIKVCYIVGEEVCQDAR